LPENINPYVIRVCITVTGKTGAVYKFTVRKSARRHFFERVFMARFYLYRKGSSGIYYGELIDPKSG
jgi:hypothetical protein